VISVAPAPLDALGDAISIDDDASNLYAAAGLALGLTADHPFAVAEQARWRRSIELGRLFFAVDEGGDRVGFAALDILDGAPYLDQLSVRMAAMRRGVGRTLLHHALAWSKDLGDALYLTTYGHLTFNRAFYEREGFVVVPDSECSPGVLHHLEEQRGCLPAPEHRVAMRKLLGA
jgi:GNAT superfamily N-acetyltransferase